MTVPSPKRKGSSLVADMRRAYLRGAFGLFVIALSVAALGWLDRSAIRSIYESRELTKLARQSRLLAVDRESSVRGYVLTGDSRLLEPDRTARELLPRKIDSLVLMAGQSATRRDAAENVKRSLDRWERGYLFPALQDRAGNNTSHDLAGKELFDSVRSAFTFFIQSEERLYQRRISWELFVVRISALIILFELLFVVVMMRRLHTRVSSQAEQLLEQQEDLEDQATELEHQAAELEMQAVQLEEQNEETQRSADALAAANTELKNTVTALENARDESRRHSTELEKAKSLLDFVLHSSPVGFGLLDTSLRFTLANEAMGAIISTPVSQLIGRSPADIAAPELAEQIEKVLTGVLESGEAVLNIPMSGSTLAEPESERFWLVSYFPVAMDSPEGRTGVGVMATEVTDRKLLEEQLLEAQKMEAVGRLAGGIAHDFNNYLTAIKSYSELLIAEMDESSSQRSDVAEINSAAERAAGLTKQLLAFSRQQMLRPEVMNLNETISRMQGTLRPLAGHSVRIETHLKATGNVKADRAQVERVVINLVMNSRDAMPDGGRIVVTTENIELEDHVVAEHMGLRIGSYVKLAVSDTGMGMTKETREKLFEPFFTTKGRGKGTGLGLASVYGIVRQSGGAIEVASEPGKGATFTIYLPREMTDSNLEIVRAKPQKPQGGATIMLVEDDDVVRNVACRVLKRAGFAVLEAENGAAAMELYEAVEYSIDLVLTDVVMPEMNGSELAERIRKVNPQAKILFMSGYTEDKVMRDKLLAPGAAFLEKPFTPDSLTRKAREVLDSPPRGAAA